MIRSKLLGATAIAAMTVITACDGQGSSPTAPSASATISANSIGASSRTGALHVTKECSEYTALAGGFCTITSSNLKAIEVGSRVVYAQALDFEKGTLDSDLFLDPPGPGNNIAFGHVTLDLATARGTVTFFGGTGKCTHFKATVHVTPLDLVNPDFINWNWDGPYSFSDKDDDSDKDGKHR
jgi:hypothetical protein